MDSRICKLGLDTTENINGVNVVRTLYDCGKYFYDGEFNVVELPEDMNIYHGSGASADNLAFIPLGRYFLDNLTKDGKPITNELVATFTRKENIYSWLSQFGGPVPGWYSNPTVVNQYATSNNPTKQKCYNRRMVYGIEVNDCILAFKLMRSMKLIVMEDLFNVIKLRELLARATPDDIIGMQPFINRLTGGEPNFIQINSPNDLMTCLSLYYFGSVEDLSKIQDDRYTPRFSILNFHLTLDPNHSKEYGKQFYLTYNDGMLQEEIRFLNRRSSRDWDLPLTAAIYYMLQTYHADKKYDGFGSSYLNSEHHHGLFHLEIVIFNAANVITRDYTNPIDWQSNEDIEKGLVLPETISYLEYLDKHVIINYKKYAGNMYENMVWTVLVTEYILSAKDSRFNKWIKIIGEDKFEERYVLPKEIKELRFVGSIIAFFYNYRQSFRCKEEFNEDDNSINFSSCIEKDSDKVYTGILVSKSLIKELLETLTNRENEVPEVPEVPVLTIFLVVTMFQDMAPYIYEYVESKINNKNAGITKLRTEILSIIIRNSIMYQFSLNRKFIHISLALIFTVIFASMMIQGSIINIVPILQNPSIPVREKNNLRSNFLPSIVNRSRPYPGYTGYITEISIEQITNILGELFIYCLKYTDTETIKIEDNYAKKISSNFIYRDTMQEAVNIMYDTLFPKNHNERKETLDVLDKYYKKLLRKEKEIENRLKTNWEKDGNHQAEPVLQDLRYTIIYELGEILNLPKSTEKDPDYAINSYYAMWIGYLGIYYNTAMENCNVRLSLQLNAVPKFDYVSITARPVNRVWYVLKILKPIFCVIFEKYSMTQYPDWKMYPPRYNHNSLNHLRSVWYTAVFLSNSNFVNSLNNMDIFLLLLGSIFKSIGRTDESNAGPSARDYDMKKVMKIFPKHGNLPKQIFPDFTKMCAVVDGSVVDVSTFKFPGTVLISMCVAYQIMCSIQDSFPNLNRSKYINTFIFSSGVIADRAEMMNQYYNCLELKDFIDSASIMSLGHYLDHCRPTTRFSQLDTITNDVVPNNPYDGPAQKFNEPKGQVWLKFFLEKYDFKEKGWDKFKEYWFEKQKYILEKTKFEKIPGGPFLRNDKKKNIEGTPVPDINVDWGQRCDTLFKRGPNEDIIHLATNFDVAWEAIFTLQSLV